MRVVCGYIPCGNYEKPTLNITLTEYRALWSVHKLTQNLRARDLVYHLSCRNPSQIPPTVKMFLPRLFVCLSVRRG